MTFDRYDLEDPKRSGAWMQPRTGGKWVLFTDVAPHLEAPTVRDQISLQALQSMMAHHWWIEKLMSEAHSRPVPQVLAHDAFAVADAFLAARGGNRK